jgi:D-sedoheptulose 7-phosphate isomerase
MKYIEDHIKVLKKFKQSNFDDLIRTSKKILTKLKSGNKILIFGNGGSSAESEHFSGELLGRFEKHNRKAINAVSLSSDSATLTAVANDYGYNQVFKRQVEGLAGPGDILFGISTSGTSKNVLKAFEAGYKLGTFNILLTGQSIKKSLHINDYISVPSTSTAIIQEIHLVIIHHICRELDKGLSIEK